MNATNTLTGEHVRNRPTRHSDAIYKRAAEILVERMRDYDIDVEDSNPADVLRDVESVMDTHGGYERARDLERRGWMPDRNMVEWLDDDTTWDAHQEAVQAWVKEEGITASLPLGARVTVSHSLHNGGTPAAGTIYDIDAKNATYTIRVPEWGHVGKGELGTQGIILTFEEVEAKNPSATVESAGSSPRGSHAGEG